MITLVIELCKSMIRDLGLHRAIFISGMVHGARDYLFLTGVSRSLIV